MTQLQELKAAIIAKVPEIMELTFGCEVYCEDGWEDETGAFHDEYGIVVEPPDKEGTCMVQFRQGFTWPAKPTLVIGQTIRLSHVLRAVLAENQKRLLKGNGEWFVNSTELQGGICGAWALAHDDLSRQSPETISFLYDILCE